MSIKFLRGLRYDVRTASAAAIVGIGVLSGCASITTGTNQSLSVETTPCLAATCKLTNDKGVWFVTNTPGSVTVNRSYQDLQVVCEKEQFKSNIFQFQSKTKAMAFGNILLGGVIGAAVDVGTGAAYDYPAIVTVQMVCLGDPKDVVQPEQPPPPSPAPVDAQPKTHK